MEDWFIDLIKKYEGFKEHAYWDTDHYSIGYGSDTMPDGSPVQKTSTITEPEAVKLIPGYIKKKEKYIREKFPNYDLLPQQVKYALIDQVYRGGQRSLDKSPKYIAAIKKALSNDNKISIDEIGPIIKELEIYTPDKNGNLLLGVQNRKRRRIKLLLDSYDPEQNKTVGDGEKDPYFNLDKLLTEIDRTKNLSQNFVLRLWDPNRQSINLEDGKIGTHKLAYREADKYDIVYPEILEIVTPVSGHLWWKKPEQRKLVDLSSDKEKAWKSALLMGDTIHIPSGMGEEFTTTYKLYYPNFKFGGNINYLNFFK